MKKLLALLLFFTLAAQAQDKQPYQLYTKDGKKTTYKKLLKKSEEAQVVLFGEYHDNSLVHWLQLEFTKDMAAQKYLVLGAEMFEADNQDELQQYLDGKIDQKALDTVARLWSNYKTDYKPIVDYAKENNIPFVATNVPRRYASQVYKQGIESLETLSDEEKSWIAPLPIPYDGTLPGYKKMMEMMGGHGGGENMPKAQAIKDATMAHFITENIKDDYVFIHFNGTYHSDNFEGISWYLKQNDPDVKVITISSVSQKEVSKLEEENIGKADFILVVDEDMTKTH
ncbi:iron-regulated protein [Flavobacterium rakeshii]|uniref:Iron-regulated protein n=1 Tax=Flavobacterium rakeshii TaxID=1038845 RepID=A0A6N8HI83_9FLAO|nr:ChaN family lipoprotein [Flavobacterium rakeshii]MUV05469.1 iron-regulated protein [Flavobacterium rakeshii]